MTTLAEACAELAAWLPQAARLIGEPDTQPSAGSGTSTGSAPPWNTAAANAWFDAHAMVRDTEQLLRYVVTGHSGQPRSWSDAALRRSLSAIERLGMAVPQDYAERAAKQLTAASTAILMLPAIDEAERPQKVAVACPYCGHAMLRVFPRSGRVTCLRVGVCQDANGQHPVGTMEIGQVSAQPCVRWADGLVAP